MGHLQVAVPIRLRDHADELSLGDAANGLERSDVRRGR